MIRRWTDRADRPLRAIVEAYAAQGRARGADRLRCALVGFGRRGLELARAAAAAQVSIVAVADAYEGRLTRAREVLGDAVALTRDPLEAIRRPGVEAVLVATPDHLHAAHVAAALDASKPVCCEHPIAHAARELPPLRAALDAGRLTAGGGVLPEPIVGAAREMVGAGRLGEISLVTGSWDTGTALDAWLYPFPPDTSAESIAWPAFATGGEPFNPAQFFRWPAYRRYGSGLVGTRFVPQLWDIHRILGLGAPSRCTAAGRTARWRDGRDTPDVLHATFEYPDVVIELSATLNGSGRPREIRVVGTDATLVLRENGMALHPQAVEEPFDALGETWPAPYREWVYMMHGLTPGGAPRGTPAPQVAVEDYTLPAPPDGVARSLSGFAAAVRAGGGADPQPATAADVAHAGLMCLASLDAGATATDSDVREDAP